MEVAATHIVTRSLDEDDDEAFLTDCEKVAKEFVKLYTFNTSVTKGALRASSGDQSVHDPTAQAVAQRVKHIGDELQDTLDSELNAIMAKQSVFEMGLPQFTASCRSVLTKCSGRMKSGWQQVYAVYYSMAKVIKELQDQPNLSDSSRRQREAHIQRFAGPVLQDFGLDTWIAAQGGLKQEPKSTDTKVAIV